MNAFVSSLATGDHVRVLAGPHQNKQGTVRRICKKTVFVAFPGEQRKARLFRLTRHRNYDTVALARVPPPPPAAAAPPRQFKALLVSEGDASFAKAFAELHPNISLVATFFDDRKVCYDKYSDAKSNVAWLKANHHEVYFRVDVHNLRDIWSIGHDEYDYIIFNFPHPGPNHASGIHSLVTTFLATSASLLAPGGLIFLTVNSTNWYGQRVRMHEVLRANGVHNVLYLQQERFDFIEPYVQQGYQHVKTNTGKLAPNENPITYVFAPWQ